MVERFIKNIAENNLFPISETILLAVSGGSDSVVLTDLFMKSGLPFAIAHVNYNLRGVDSIGDAEFVRAMALRLGKEYHELDIDLKKDAKSQGQSVQMAARDVRYDWLEKIRAENNYFAIATAHHANDSVETFFLNLTAGCGIRGLHGIPVKRGHIVRPLLNFTKKELLEYSISEQLNFREDSSNVSNYYMRNFIRNKIVPLFDELNPQFIPVMQSNIQRIKEAEELYNISVTKYLNEIIKIKNDLVEIDIDKLSNLSFKNTILYEGIKDYGFSSNQTEDILRSMEGSGKQFLSKTHQLVVDRNKLLIRNKSEISAKEDTITIDKDTKTINLPTAYLRFNIENKPANIPNSGSVFYLDLEQLQFPLILRKWQHGDYFYPLGMKGKKKLKEFFIDNKFSLFDKEDIWLITSNEEIALIIGHRLDDRYKITDKTTLCLRVTVVEKED